MNDALIIFLKNPELGKVKTRLAATIGNEKALELYEQLVSHTLISVKNIMADIFIYFSDNIDENIFEFENHFFRKIQTGKDLGERMSNAFEEVFDLWYDKVLIIGTDCPAINLNLLDDAFDLLNDHDVVIGPATDGGYYLLGSKKFYPELFEHINWSTSTVLDTTIHNCFQNQLAHVLLPQLSDIDDEKDLDQLVFLQK